MNRNLVQLFLAAITAALFSGCGSVTVYKVTPEGTKTVGPNGIRYYLPRPYVSVFEPFVIDSTPYLVSGQLTADRQFVAINHVPRLLKDKFASDETGGPVLVPLENIAAPIAGNGGLQ